MSEKKDRSKLIFGAIIVVLCVFFVVGVAYGANSLLEMEGTLEPADKYVLDGYAQVPESAQDVIDLVSTAVKNAVEAKPKLDSSDSISIGDELLIGEDSASAVNTMAKFLKDNAADEFAAAFSDLSADFGAGFADKLWIPTLTAEDIDGFECNYIYYHCMQCGADAEEPYAKCSECGNENGPQMRYRDEYSITINLRQGAAALQNNFRLREPSKITDFIGDKFSDFANITAPVNFEYKNARIFVRINRHTGQLYEIKYIKDVDLTTKAEFIGDYAYAGEAKVYLPVYEEVGFWFTWPGVSLSAHELSMAHKKTEALKATLTCDDPLLYDVTWTSSDESIATVDADGYVESNKVDGKVIITASFEFQGKTYTDECEVFVKTSVESIDITKRDLTLKKGETFAQKVSYSPKESTVQTAKWYTTDETVATVDENGVITAIGVGEAEVYAVSDDGYFKATCKVEVTE
ncbi:MAG: Ig-like domain-containing protein [Clostridia bacterium]|nr:Ig-like domain-containing protein [Clostridia bacterium]